MLITISNVNVVTPAGKKYQQADVQYTDVGGNTKTWKLLSFANPATFAALKDAKPGESYEIALGKNDKDYTTWTSATKQAGATPAVGAAKAAWVPDADRQRLIVKQSSLTAALKFFEIGKSTPTSTQEVTNLADEFVAYVYDVEEPAVEEA